MQLKKFLYPESLKFTPSEKKIPKQAQGTDEQIEQISVSMFVSLNGLLRRRAFWFQPMFVWLFVRRISMRMEKGFVLFASLAPPGRGERLAFVC